MKLATALSQRADLQRKLSELNTRLYNNAKAQEGEAPSELVLEVEKKHHCHYGTPFGSLMLGVYTKSIDNRLSDEGGKLEMCYVIDSNGAFVSENWISLSVKTETV